MKIKYLIISGFFIFTLQVQAQIGFEKMLSDIATNNKTIQVQAKYWEAQKLQFQTGNTLYDPMISYDYMHGSPNAIAGNQTDINVTQRFDFPTVYGRKKVLASEKMKQADFALLNTKQNILLEAKKIGIELIYRNKLQAKIEERKKKTEIFQRDFQKKLDAGEGNILDLNKVKLQHIEINKDYQENLSAINQLKQRLIGLNGGKEIDFNDKEYPEFVPILSFEDFRMEIEANDPIAKYLQQQNVIAQHQIAVTKALTLPQFEAGYHYQGILGQNFNGIKVGMSIPLWENKNRVAQSEAELSTNEAQLAEYKSNYYSELKQLYEKYINLQKTLNEYQSVLGSIHSIQLLDKSLQYGEITTIQYFLEVSYFYTATNNYLLIEKEFNEVVAAMYKFQLK